jgi:hypothetical protein
MRKRYETPKGTQKVGSATCTWQPQRNITKTRRQNKTARLILTCTSVVKVYVGHLFGIVRLPSWANASHFCWILFKFGVYGVRHNLSFESNAQMDTTHSHSRDDLHLYFHVCTQTNTHTHTHTKLFCRHSHVRI